MKTLSNLERALGLHPEVKLAGGLIITDYRKRLRQGMARYVTGKFVFPYVVAIFSTQHPHLPR